MENNKEDQIRSMLKIRNFTVNEKHLNDNSIDIVAIKDGNYFLIEVKSKTPQDRIRIDQASENSELVVILTDNGFLYALPINNCPLSKVHKFMDLL